MDPRLINQEGHLLHATDWSEDIALHIAQREGLDITNEHWEIIYQVRNFYLQHHKLPTLTSLTAQLNVSVRKINQRLVQLFPDGLMKQVMKIAGLPQSSDA